MEIKKFKGLKNTTGAERLAPGYLEVAQNVDIDDTLRVLTRMGSTLAAAGSFHSLWADESMCLAVKSGALQRVNADYSLTPLVTLSSDQHMAYAREGGVVYYSNGVDKGRVHPAGVGEWGVRAPVGQPRAAPGAGVLPAGRYLYALTFLRADGAESGAGPAGMIELAAPGGITFSEVESSSDPDVSSKIIYLSGPNGQELFRAAVLPPSRASISVQNVPGGARMEGQFSAPPPAGHILECHAGVMYVVRAGVAYYSDPYAYERFRARQFLPFPGRVTMFSAVSDGVYVSTDDRTWFLAGRDPSKLDARLVFDFGAIPGTPVKTTVGTLKSEEEAREGAPGGTAVMWASARGMCVGGEGGVALNLTERTFSVPTAQRGAGVVRQARGYTQYIAALEGAGSSPNAFP